MKIIFFFFSFLVRVMRILYTHNFFFVFVCRDKRTLQEEIFGAPKYSRPFCRLKIDHECPGVGRSTYTINIIIHIEI